MTLQNTENKEKSEEEVTIALENKEIDFILEKLEIAQYMGYEFETYYSVWVKLSKMKK